MNVHTQVPVIDPATVVIAALRREVAVIDRAGAVEDEPTEHAAWARWSAANALLERTDPTSIDGVISYLRYVIEEDDKGTDISCLVPMLHAAVRGLCKMREAA